MYISIRNKYLINFEDATRLAAIIYSYICEDFSNIKIMQILSNFCNKEYQKGNEEAIIETIKI